MRDRDVNIALTEVTNLLGKKKRHTLRSQITLNKGNKDIICTSFTNRKMHDFHLYKKSNVGFHPDIKSINDFFIKEKIKGKIGNFKFENGKVTQDLKIYKLQNNKFIKN